MKREPLVFHVSLHHHVLETATLKRCQLCTRFFVKDSTTATALKK